MKISNEQIDKLLDELLELHPKRIDLSLDRVCNLLEKLDNPQNKINNIVHIAGTNGKFSTLKFIQDILKSNSKSTNAYISPHLIRFNERFQLMDKEISNEELYSVLNKVKDFNHSDPITFFEITSSAFFEAASNSPADYTLLEVGLGGRLDSSNVITPAISVITSISRDHQDFLGDSIEMIAFEKSGIIKSDIPAIIGYQPYPEAREMLMDQAEYKKAPIFAHGIHWNLTEHNDKLIYEDNQNKIEFDNLYTHNVFQKKNLGLALAAASKLTNIDIKSFVSKNLHNKTYFPGRMEKISDGKLGSTIASTNELYLDGSHNEDAASNLNETINQLTNKKLCIILGMINTKDPISYLSKFDKIDALTVITIPNEESAIDSNELYAGLKKYYENVNRADSIQEALANLNNNYQDARILICGSLYLAGKVLEMN
ncbi:MAG: bifunctional folylpolyglutamate synthase/dihydrofolate synthase [Candidatus Pelagibacterales bacterium]|nr:MAG: bifunctional folylpolyglutamate synthase/dihydrofolate synthase [Pelagibacterales bacterium]